MKGNLNIIGCGGAGINIAINVANALDTLKDKISNITVRLIDTTDKTIQIYPEYESVFSRIEDNGLTSMGIDGTGGERKNKELINKIDTRVKEFIDRSKLSNNINDYYVVIFSLSGGTGSVVGPLMIKYMLEKDYTVIPVMVGDDSNLLMCNNTLNTLATVNNIARVNKTAIGGIYFNNNENGQVTFSTEQEVNNKIFKMLVVISTFISGNIQNIDNMDMRNFFIPTRYKTFNVSPGLYSLGTTVDVLDDENAILARTIIKDLEDIDVRVPLLHNKTGKALDISSELFVKYPIYLLFRKNVINNIINELNETFIELEKIKNNKNDDFELMTDVEEDDTGLLL